MPPRKKTEKTFEEHVNSEVKKVEIGDIIMTPRDRVEFKPDLTKVPDVPPEPETPKYQPSPATEIIKFLREDPEISPYYKPNTDAGMISVILLKRILDRLGDK